MDETLLFLHVLAAFVLVSGVVVFSAVALGASIGPGSITLGNRLTEIGGTAVLVFGIWIALREDAYSITDGWILGAIALWIVGTGAGTMAGRGMSEGEDPRLDRRGTMLHWLGAAAVLGILVLMIWKPGA